ncbi:dehydrogenase [Rhizobium oryziradicis]|uniref:Dehydrogenase n=2 Tax=Rhizobium oryziradicis TaxID=1867956 RepID=A0A1Q8ZWN6_9HYPH|nr:dehydrogenase [Rhizobium oryziradicis]
MTSARALWFPSQGQCEIRREALPPLEAGQARVRMLFSGISRGTESLIFQGRVPESEFARMRGPNMAGDFPFPVKYGYAAVGRVEEGPEPWLGKTVFCLHPHQDIFTVPTDMLTLLPSALPAQRAVLAANMETALNIVWDAGILPGDKVAVFGAGVVGVLVSFLASQIAGTDIDLLDPNPSRALLAAHFGLNFYDSDPPSNAYDVMINASGSPEALALALNHAGQEARIVEASWYGDTILKLALGGPFHARRLSIISSQVGTIPPAQRARWTFARRLKKALDLLLDDRLDALISAQTAFDDIAAAYSEIISDPQTLCHRICY